MRSFLFFLQLNLLLFLSTTLAAQQFGAEEVITTAANGAFSVYAADLDGDGDADVLSASRTDDKIAWYENLGGGVFGPQQVITTAASDAWSVYAADLDGDGDIDVLSASSADGEIAWYENLGSGSFGSQQIITSLAGAARSVYATDLDGDGDTDVLSASYGDDKIAWYENLGGGSFGTQQVITDLADGAHSVYATDLEGDGDADVLSASFGDGKIAWYENLGGGAFGAQQVITTDASSAYSVYATDLDGDGDADVLSASGNNRIAWYENLGGGAFGTQQVITTVVNTPYCVFATDLDGDGDADVLSASANDDKIAWYENLGGGTFGTQQVITDLADIARSVYATDLDGDGAADVLSASADDNKIAWYDNLIPPDTDKDSLSDIQEDSNDNGIVDAGETDPLDQDTDDDGLSDGEEVNALRIDTRWLQGPNGNFYRLASSDSWSQARVAAAAQGYDLTSVQDQAESDWLFQTFGDVGDGYWIGLNDFSGFLEWSDGSPVSFTNWATGEPSSSFIAAYAGGAAEAEPGHWYGDVGGAGPRLSVWEAPGPNAPQTALDPLSWDTDGDGLGDGQEDGLDAIIWDGFGIPGVTGTDSLVFIPDSDPLTTTDPINLDSDNDGIADGEEDLDADGAVSFGETDASLADTDADGLPDGLELGLSTGTLDTDGAVFIPDADPATTTDPLLADSDSGGVDDGIEDQSHDGAVNTWETDPNIAADEALAFYVSGLTPGERLHFEVYNADANSVLAPVLSVVGPGPTFLGIGVTVELSLPITALQPSLANVQGRAIWDGPPVPGALSLGRPIWLQLVEIPFGPGGHRVSNPILLPVGSN